MVRMIFRHISGTRATQIDIVTIGAHRELILGRASSAAIRFDSRGDNQVGRQHARIVWNLDNQPSFQLTDLGSRNGTYLNGQRIQHAMSLGLGDVVRLGATGPEVAVTWEVTPNLATPHTSADQSLRVIR
jgi:pSer/pThr/pTyr-binding forkhead associated (FHA) protein